VQVTGSFVPWSLETSTEAIFFIDATCWAFRFRRCASDIPILAEYFLTKYANLLGKAPCRLSRAAIDEAISYLWPGNIRELENTMERILNLAHDETIEHLGRWLGGTREENRASSVLRFESRAISLVDVRPLRDQEGAAVREALEACRYNVTRCASLLGVSKPALYAKIKRYRIRLERPL